MLGLGALALGPMGGFGALKGLLGSGALGGLKGGILPGILGLLTARALQGEGKDEAISFDDFESMFKFNNPKATSSCGCGTSFAI